MKINLKKHKNRHGQVWINVASSTGVLNDFINLDGHIFLRLLSAGAWIENMIPKKNRALFNEFIKAKKISVFLVHNCKKPLPVSNQSVDHILCSHFLEHVYPVEAKKIIEDFYRVLKPSGTLHVIVPDLKVMAKEYLAQSQSKNPAASHDFMKNLLLSREDQGSFPYRLLELLGCFGLQHRWMYDAESMQEKLKKVGFEILSKNDTPSKAYRANDGSCHVVARKIQ